MADNFRNLPITCEYIAFKALVLLMNTMNLLVLLYVLLNCYCQDFA
jgi:hypothetical protein